jgi:hypothetical protein
LAADVFWLSGWQTIAIFGAPRLESASYLCITGYSDSIPLARHLLLAIGAEGSPFGAAVLS